jgi:uncharacterized protein (TIGR02246 family)
VQEADVRATIQTYREALEARDLARCVACYAEDAVIHFGTGLYRGKEAITEWHQDRFAANLRIVHFQEIQIEGDKAALDVAVSSDKLKAWKISRLRATTTILFDGGKFREVKFNVRMTSPFEAW